MVWRTVNSILGKVSPETNGIINEIHVHGMVIKNPNEISNQLNSFFIKAPLTLSGYLPEQNLICKDSVAPFSLFLAPTSYLEISKIIKSLKNTGSVTVEDVSCKILKKCHEILSPKIADMINCSLECGLVPKCLKIARVVTIGKQGDLRLPENYKPISILSPLSKIFEIIFKDRLMTFLDSHDLIAKLCEKLQHYICCLRCGN